MRILLIIAILFSLSACGNKVTRTVVKTGAVVARMAL